MSKNRYNPRRDLNEPGIIRALEGAGALVRRLSEAGIPDLLVGFRGALFLLEIKNPDASHPRMQDKQDAFFEVWQGYSLHVVWDADEALRAIGAIE